MALKDFYKLTYGSDAKPFETNKSLAEFIYTDAVTITHLYQKKHPNKIAQFDIINVLLHRMGLKHDDIYFCLSEALDDSADSVLFEAYTNDELFDECRANLLKLSKSTLSKLNINKDNCKNNKTPTYFNSFLLAGLGPLSSVVCPELNFQSKDLIDAPEAKDYKAILKFFYSIDIENVDMKKVIKMLVEKLEISIEEVQIARQSVIENVDKDLIENIEKYLNGKNINSTSQDISISKKNAVIDNIQKIKESVIGQDEAIEKVQKRLMAAFVGFKAENQPVASFLLTGPTGVGKTETAKAVAECYFDGKFYVVDMSTYKNDIDVSRLLGGSPNYVGYNDKNGFCEFIKENPKSVILFDEIEKAHPDCLDILMRILDEGKFINAKGEELSLENCVIFYTTNISESKRPTVGFGAKTSIDEVVVTEGAGLRKETIGRFSEIINYQKLTKESAKQILKNKFMKKVIDGFAKRNNNGLTLECSDSIYDSILEDANISLFGARDLKKSIQKLFINPVTNYIIENEPKNKILVVGKDIIVEKNNENQKGWEELERYN